jgi:hypothetical protein
MREHASADAHAFADRRDGNLAILNLIRQA